MNAARPSADVDMGVVESGHEHLPAKVNDPRRIIGIYELVAADSSRSRRRLRRRPTLRRRVRRNDREPHLARRVASEPPAIALAPRTGMCLMPRMKFERSRGRSCSRVTRISSRASHAPRGRGWIGAGLSRSGSLHQEWDFDNVAGEAPAGRLRQVPRATPMQTIRTDEHSYRGLSSLNTAAYMERFCFFSRP